MARYRARMDSVANWAGNVAFRATALHRPASMAELQRLVAGSPRIRALGTGHSFSGVADTGGELVSLATMPAVVEVDSQRGAVRVSAGLRYSDVAPRLHAAGLALGNMASLPHISVAGAVATGTHGSGNSNKSLAAAVSALDLMTADGDLVTLERGADPDRFPGAVVALGACGIVTSLTLEAGPAFADRQWVYLDVPFTAAAEHFDEITAAAYSVSMFTDWRQQRFTQTWLKRREPGQETPATWLGGRLADADVHPVAGMPVRNCTPQLGLPGPWHERLPHFRSEFTPSAGAELQSEFLLPRSHAVAALQAVRELRDEITAVLQICELRTVAADELWLSPSYRRPTVGVHFTWVDDTAAVMPVVAAVEERLAPFEPRPHWGKVYLASGRYERLADFTRLAQEFDPAGKFGQTS